MSLDELDELRHLSEEVMLRTRENDATGLRRVLAAITFRVDESDACHKEMLSTTTVEGATPLHLSAYCGHCSVLRVLLSVGD